MHRVGIDVGYGYTKAAADGVREVVFASVIGRAERIRYQTETFASLSPRLESKVGGSHGLSIGLDGSEYFVGELALKQSRVQFTLLNRSRTTSDQLKVLFLAALSELIGRGHVEVQVVTGLPVEYYQDRELLAGQLLGRHRVSRNGSEQAFSVQTLKVIPQPFGTLFWKILSDDGYIVEERLARARVGIVDIGVYTTDYVLADWLTYIEKGSGSIPVAMSTAYGLLAREILDQYGLELSLHNIDACVRTRSVKVYGARQDIGPLVDPVLEGVGEEIVSKARTLWGEGRDLDAIMITGGGAEALGRYFQVYPHAVVVPDPAMANVRGYLKYANRVFRVG